MIDLLQNGVSISQARRNKGEDYESKNNNDLAVFQLHARILHYMFGCEKKARSPIQGRT